MMNRIKDAFDLIRRTPAGRQVLKEHEREISTDRELHVAAIETAQAKLHDALPKLDETISKTQAQLDRVHKALETAEATHRDALLARGNAVHRAGHTRDTHQQALAKGADPRIPEVARKLTVLYMREARGGLIAEYEETGLFDPIHRQNPLMRVSNNSAARARRMTAMRDAIVAIKALQFDRNADVSEQMTSILEGLPDGTVLEFVCESYSMGLGGRQVIDLYKPVDVAEGFSEVLQPVEFVSRDDDGGTGGGIDIATVRPMAR